MPQVWQCEVFRGKLNGCFLRIAETEVNSDSLMHGSMPDCARLPVQCTMPRSEFHEHRTEPAAQPKCPDCSQWSMKLLFRMFCDRLD